MSYQQNAQMQKLKFDAADKEALELHAKACWNKFTRFADKFSELTFIICLSITGLYVLIMQFVVKSVTFDLLRTLLAFYYIFMAMLIFASWKAKVNFLIYFGFMRGRLSKCLFLLFCACMSFPNKRTNVLLGWPSWIVACVLCVMAIL